jgi:hypothetical protein
MDKPKGTFGGPQTNAGRKPIPEEDKVVQRTLYLPPELDGRLVDAVGNGRGAIGGEIIRILELYFAETKVI